MEKINNIDGIKYQKKVKELKEGFDNANDESSYSILYNQYPTSDAINTINNRDLSELDTLKNEYETALASYQNEFTTLSNMINNYNKSSNSQYRNKNVRLPTGEIGYVTNNGIWKQYPSMPIYNSIAGRKQCPALNDIRNLNGTIDTRYNIVDIDANNKFIIGSSMKEGQRCGLSGTNVYVTNTEAPITSQQYSGCYNFNDNNGLVYQSDMGSSATLNACRIRAFDKNKEVFAISSSNGKTTGKCYIGDILSNVVNAGQAIFSKVIWRPALEPIPNAYSARLNLGGQLEILDVNQNILWVSSKNSYDNCDPIRGGTISVKDATWGANCDNKRDPVTQQKWDVKIHNLVNYARSIADGKDRADFVISKDIILPETNTPIGDPAEGCLKNFVTWYRCGKQGGHLLKKIDINPEANGKTVVYNCQSHTERCKMFKLYLSDEPNVFIKDDKTNTNIWNANIANVPQNSVSTNEYNSSAGKYERDYIVPGEILEDGDFIGSPNGNFYLIFIKNVGLELRINLSGCKKHTDNNYYGGNITDDMTGMYFTVYNRYFGDNLLFFNTAQITQSGVTNNLTNIESSTNNKYTSSNRYFSLILTGSLYVREGQTGNWNFKLNSDDASYMWIGEDNVKNSTPNNAFINNGGTHKPTIRENTIKLDGGNFYPIKIIYGNNNHAGTFNFTFSGPGVSERSILDGYIYAYTPNDGLATYTINLNGDNINNLGKVGYVTPDGKLKTIPTRLTKLSNNQYSQNYIEIGNYTNPDNNISIIDSNNIDFCKEKCNEIDNCAGFVYKDNKCELKNSDMYPKSNRIYDESAKLFKRNIDVLTPDSCSKNIVPINNNTWNDFAISETEAELNENSKCEMSSYLNEQKNKVSEESKKLEDISNKLMNAINKSTKNKNLLNKNIDITSKNILDTLHELNNNKTMYDSKIKESNINEKAMKLETYSELLTNNYNYLVWSILAVSIAIGGIYIIKKNKVNILPK